MQKAAWAQSALQHTLIPRLFGNIHLQDMLAPAGGYRYNSIKSISVGMIGMKGVYT